MTQHNAAQALLILLVTPKLEEVLVDFLLQQTAISGFTTTPASGHGTSHGAGHSTLKLSLVEQVTGRQRRVQIMLHATLPVMQELIAALKAEFKHTDMHYILLPVLEAQSI
jgi:hypothetical protein